MSDQWKYDDEVRTCPYCNATHKPESCDYSTESRIMECDSCGKSYRAWEELIVMFYTHRITGE